SLLIRGTTTRTHDEPVRTAEIVLARHIADHTEYFADEPGFARHSALKPISSDGSAGVAPGGAVVSDQPPLIAGISLPDFVGNLAAGEGLVAAPQLGEPRRGPPRLPVNPLDEAAILAED